MEVVSLLNAIWLSSLPKLIVLLDVAPPPEEEVTTTATSPLIPLGIILVVVVAVSVFAIVALKRKNTPKD